MIIYGIVPRIRANICTVKRKGRAERKEKEREGGAVAASQPCQICTRETGAPVPMGVTWNVGVGEILTRMRSA